MQALCLCWVKWILIHWYGDKVYYGFEYVHTYLNILQSTFEAQYLANQVQLYYGTNQPDRFALAKQFNHDPQNFDYNTVLDQLQNTDIKRETQSETW